MGLCFSEPAVQPHPQTNVMYTTAPVSTVYKAQVIPTPRQSFAEGTGDPQNIKEYPAPHSQYHYTNAYQTTIPQVYYGAHQHQHQQHQPQQAYYATAPPAMPVTVPIYVVPQQPKQPQQQNQGMNTALGVAGGFIAGSMIADILSD
jgi:hypothetical protein